MVRLLEERGAEVEVRSLPSGDYVVAPNVVVERKRVPDLHLSVVDGRLWLQLGAMRRDWNWRFLLVEGNGLDAGPLTSAAVRGTLLSVMEQGCRLLQTASSEDSARWLYQMAVRYQSRLKRRDRPAYALRPAALAGRASAEAMLAGVPGISVMTARSLLARFGSVAAVVAAGPDEWQTVEGVGPARAAALNEVLMLSWPKAAKAQDPST
jgi:ERCC4-type nuclease